jgi:GxxExxY protein
MKQNFLYHDLSREIIGCSFRVHTKLGSFLPEHCYESALMIELEDSGIPAVRQVRYEVYFKDQHVGHFFSDIVVDGKVILELKSADSITHNHESQLFTYLRASGLKVGYVLNFGVKSFQFKRLIL